MINFYRPVVQSLPLKRSKNSDHESIELSPLSSEDDESYNYSSSHFKSKHASKPSLFLALCKTFIVSYVTAGFLKLINDLLNFVGPLLLK